MTSGADFSSHLRQILAMPDAAAKWQALRTACSADLEFVQVIQLNKALERARQSEAPDLPNARLALLASSTVDHLVPALRVAALARGMWLDIHQGGYGLYRQELMQPDPALAGFKPDFVLLCLSARELISSLPVGASNSEVDGRLSAEIEQLRGLWQNARSQLGATVIQQTYLDVASAIFGNFDRHTHASPVRVVHDLNHRLLQAMKEEGVLLVDIARESTREGLNFWFDQARWFQGKLEIAPAAAARYGDLVAQVLGGQRGLARKCLVLDLDNTVWGGVIGDDGVTGIVLGEGSAAGEAHLHLQRYALQLKERGIVLAVCSKNEESIARAAFDQHPEMALRTDDIAVFVANWQDKAANLQMIAERLNLGIDSLVFVDDNPVERARVRETLPGVAVPELPEDPAGYVDCIVRGGYFEAASFTQEDKARAQEYAANAERTALQQGTQSMDQFLAGLDMVMEFGEATAIELPRITQLVNKTNQFNTTTRRYTADEIHTLADSSDSSVWYFRLRDRFSDNGLVSVVLLSGAAQQDGERTVCIDNWVMSCRVFGRQFEDAIMNGLVERAAAQGVTELHAAFKPTPKNGVIADLYSRLGFLPVPDAASDPADLISHWRLPIGDYSPAPTFIDAQETHKE